MDIKKTLKAYGFNDSQIAKFERYYSHAIENEFPYPESYAMVMTMV